MIRNKKTGQMYIGQSKNIERRFRYHCSLSNIDKAILLEGKDNFDFIIIEETSEDKLLEREKYWIEYYNTYDNDYHYNMSDGSKHDNICLPNGFKYFLWNSRVCFYQKRDMCKPGREPNPCRCFRCAYNNRSLPIGQFHDFVSCEIINQLIKEAIKDEIK